MSPENHKIIVNNNLILRDGELFVRKTGIGFYRKDIELRYQNQATTTDEGRYIWLPSETSTVLQELEEKGSTLLMGGLGSGKSALLYGIRSTYRDLGKPYFYYDGHFQKTSPAKIHSGLEWALDNKALVIWDSLDYLISSCKQVRKLPKDIHIKRSTDLFDQIESFMNDSGTLVASSHDGGWLDKKGDPQLLQNFRIKFAGRLNRHNITGKFDNPNEVIAFYSTTIKVEPEEASYLAYISDNQYFVQFLLNRHPENITQEILNSLRSYRIAKLIAFDNGSASSLLNKIHLYSQKQIDESDLWTTIENFVLLKNAETIKKGGIIH